VSHLAYMRNSYCSLTDVVPSRKYSKEELGLTDLRGAKFNKECIIEVEEVSKLNWFTNLGSQRTLRE
jgi:hypothetical protein